MAITTPYDAEIWRYEHGIAVVQSQKILRCAKNLQACKPSERPGVLVELSDANCVFPERQLETRANELARLHAMHSDSNRYPDRVLAYIVEDLKKGGPIARLVNLIQEGRKASGLRLPLLAPQLFEIYNNAHRRKTGQPIASLPEFLTEVSKVESILSHQTPKITRSEFLFAARLGEFNLAFGPVLEQTGPRAVGHLGLSTMLDESGFSENGGTLIDLGGHIGLTAKRFQDLMDKEGKPFGEAHSFDRGTREILFKSPFLWDTVNSQPFTLTEKDKQEIEQTIHQHFEFDLTTDNLTSRLDVEKIRKPITYALRLVTPYWDEKHKLKIFERLRDIPNALRREPVSFLYLEESIAYNPTAMGRLIIDLNTGRLHAGRIGFTLRNENVRGTEDGALQILEDTLVDTIKRIRKYVIDEEKRFKHDSSMNGNNFEQLCKEHRLETGKYEF